jgi:hypothetical protein
MLGLREEDACDAHQARDGFSGPRRRCVNQRDLGFRSAVWTIAETGTSSAWLS